MIRILEDKDAQSLIERKAVRLEEAERIVAPILADVRARGDASLVRHGADPGLAVDRRGLAKAPIEPTSSFTSQTEQP